MRRFYKNVVGVKRFNESDTKVNREIKFLGETEQCPCPGCNCHSQYTRIIFPTCWFFLKDLSH